MFSRIMVTGTSQQVSSRLKRSTIRRVVGVYMSRRVMRTGTIDDLSRCVNDVTHRGKVDRIVDAMSLTLSFLSSPYYYITTNMELLGPQTIDIAPNYLLQLSKQVDSLNKMALLDRQGPLTQEYSQTLQNQFTQLAQYLTLYHQDAVMKDSSILRCKFALQFYVWSRANRLLGGVEPQLAQIMQFLLREMQEQLSLMEGLVHRERMSKAEVLDHEKDRIIAALRRDLSVKREYMIDLEQRVKQIQDENSKLYSKMISNAKQKIDYYNKSPKNPQYKSMSIDKNSPRKKILTKTFEDQINQILQSKWKIQNINEKKVSLVQYLKTYFTMKYGKPLAEQNQTNFKQTVAYLAKTQQRHIFILFQAVLDEECDEAYFLQERSFLEKVIKCLKRYLNQRYNRPLHELQRIFQSRLDDKNDVFLSQTDVETLLTNIYKSGEVRTLQMILSELVSSRSTESNKLSCKRFLNEMLEYQMKKHLMRVEDIVRQINRLPDKYQHVITLEQLQKIALRVISDKDRCEWFLRQYEDDKKWTVSQVIQMVERARHAKFRKD